jgi:hypothetical protein
MAFTYPGKLDKLNGSSVTPPGALGEDQCYSEYSQLYVEQGAYILDPEQNLTSLGAKASVDDCAAACGGSCQYFSFVYTDDVTNNSAGTCYVRNQPEGLPNSSKKLFYKMIPTQDMAGQSASGKSVSIGIYAKWSTVVNELEQGSDVANPPPPTSSIEACLTACDNDASCVLVYFDATAETRKCVLKAGAPAPQIRTAIHGVSSTLIAAANQGGDGAACTVDGDCLLDRCDSAKKTCIAAHCLNGVKDADEICADGGGADCPACSSGQGELVSNGNTPSAQ